ncbi:hypothetical protein CR513_42496, partial [Mucuna pruriens]
MWFVYVDDFIIKYDLDIILHIELLGTKLVDFLSKKIIGWLLLMAEATTYIDHYLKSNLGQMIFLRFDSDLKLGKLPSYSTLLNMILCVLEKISYILENQKQVTKLKWLRALLVDLQVPHPQSIRLFCDSQVVLNLVSKIK